MQDIVSSAVVQETVSQVLSGLVKKYEEIEESDANRNLERLEMAHIRLEAALETSDKWQITDASLLCWRRKLKRAAQDCDDTLHICKQRILEDEQMQQRVRNSSFPSRIAHATKSFVSSIVSCDKKRMRSTVQRFEWFVDGATEFLRFVELGGTPRSHISFYSLVNNLFAGKELHHKIIGGNQHPSSQLWLEPFGTAEHGTEAILIFIQKHDSPSLGNINFSIVLQISESTDIVGTAIQCLQLFAPHFKCAVENVRKELAQLPTQCLSWMPSVYSNKKDRIHVQNHISQWVRPKPLCCKKHNNWHELQHICNPDMVGLVDDFLKPVIEVNLQCHVSSSLYNKQRTSPFEDRISLQESSYLKAGIYFTPHRTSEDMLPANRFSEIVAIVGEDQHCLQADVPLEQLEEIMLPKSIDYFHQNTEATIYKMIWKCKHSSALIQVERENMSTQKTFGGARKRRELLRGHNEELISRKSMISHLLDLWRAHIPIHLTSAFKDWLQKERESYSIAATPEILNHVT